MGQQWARGLPFFPFFRPARQVWHFRAVTHNELFTDDTARPSPSPSPSPSPNLSTHPHLTQKAARSQRTLSGCAAVGLCSLRLLALSRPSKASSRLGRRQQGARRTATIVPLARARTLSPVAAGRSALASGGAHCALAGAGPRLLRPRRPWPWRPPLRPRTARRLGRRLSSTA